MKNKLSHYTIFTEIINEENERLVYSTRSGMTMIISDTCFYFLTNDLLEHIPENICSKLFENKVLVPFDENELHNIISQNNEEIDYKEGELYEVIQPSANCQLGCYYCGQQHEKDNLENEIIDKISNRILWKFDRGQYKGIYLAWFGGEPLMGLKQMRALNKKIKSFCNEKNITYGGKIVTNGLSLKPNIFLELANEFGIDKIEITLDGIAKYHDEHRYLKTGGKSFDLIYKNLKNILLDPDFEKNKCSISIRCNVDYKNIDGVLPLIEKLAADGLHKKIAYFYPVGVYSWGGNDAQKKSLTKEEFAMLQMKWKTKMIELGYYKNFPLPGRKKTACIAVGGESEMYDAYGNVFNCTEISYSDFYKGSEYILGNLKSSETLVYENKPLNDWHEIVENTTDYPCHSCRLLPVCGGSCPKAWKEGNPACPPFKFNIRKDIELKYLLKRTDANNLNSKLNKFSDMLTINDFKRN